MTMFTNSEITIFLFLLVAILAKLRAMEQETKRVMRPGTTHSANPHASAQVAPQHCLIL